MEEEEQKGVPEHTDWLVKQLEIQQAQLHEAHLLLADAKNSNGITIFSVKRKIKKYFQRIFPNY